MRWAVLRGAALVRGRLARSQQLRSARRDQVAQRRSAQLPTGTFRQHPEPRHRDFVGFVSGFARAHIFTPGDRAFELLGYQVAE